MTYTPTKEELEEMGFKTNDSGSTYINIDSEKYISYERELFTLVIWEELEHTASDIYPRSLDHLRQIILAFTPNEQKNMSDYEKTIAKFVTIVMRKQDMPLSSAILSISNLAGISEGEIGRAHV